MAFDRDEQEIQKMFEPFRLKRPPDSLFKGYEEEVWKKIHASTPRPAFGLGIVLSAVVIGALLLGLILFIRPGIVKERTAPTPTVPLEAEDSVLEELAEDFLILEMLGEDEDLLELWSPSPSLL